MELSFLKDEYKDSTFSRVNITCLNASIYNNKDSLF